MIGKTAQCLLIVIALVLLGGCGGQNATEQAISEALPEHLPGAWRVIDLSIVEQDAPPAGTAFDHRYVVEARVAPQKNLYSAVIQDIERTVIAPVLKADAVYPLTARVLGRDSGADAYFYFRFESASWMDDIASAKPRDLWPDTAIATGTAAFDAELAAQHERMDGLWQRLLENADEQKRVRAQLARQNDARQTRIASARQRLEALDEKQAEAKKADWAAFMAARDAARQGGDKQAVDAARETLKTNQARRAERRKQARQHLETLLGERTQARHDLETIDERTRHIMRLRLAAMADQEDRLAELETYATADQQRTPVDTSAFVAFCDKSGMSGDCRCLRDALLETGMITPDMLVLTAWFAQDSDGMMASDFAARFLRRARAAHLRPANALYAPQTMGSQLQRASAVAAQKCQQS